MKKIFISYSTKEHHKILELIEKLKRKMPELKDAEIWDPSSNLTAGADFRKEIKKQILSSDVYVLLWTNSAANSPWVLYEAGMADASGIPILIMVEPGSPELHGALSMYKTIKLENES
jgi:hypothetical protein